MDTIRTNRLLQANGPIWSLLRGKCQLFAHGLKPKSANAGRGGGVIYLETVGGTVYSITRRGASGVLTKP